MRNQRIYLNEREARMSIRNMSQSSVLENAGMVKAKEVTNSDRYLAIKLSREFDQVLESLSLRDATRIDRSDLFDILVQLSLLKSLDNQNSQFI